MAKVLRFIVNIFLIVTILGAVVILVPPLLGVTTTIVDTETMDTNLPLGSITYSKDISVADIQPGDKILKETSTSTYLYVIQSGDLAKGTYQAINGTKANAEPEEIVLRNNVSRVVLTIPFIGYVLVAMHSMEGLIIIGLVLIFMIVLFILSELWKKDDDYDDEDEDDEYDDDEYDDETEADVVDIKNKGKNMSRKDRKEAKKQAALKEKQRAKKAKEQAKQEKREAKRAKKQAAYDEEFEAFYADGTKDEEEAWTRPVYVEESDDVLPVRQSEPQLSETGTLLDTREIELRELEAQLGIVKEEAPVEVSED
ncbi:MAG: hypothetical protein KBS83_01425, partial [Lachnospiraceae bacterium]|nr:hypothetical protein [Candidatus Equihabitans merdae]